MASITKLVPIRIDASSSDGAVRIIDTLLLDTTCLPISHAHPLQDGNSSGLSSLSRGGSSDGGSHSFSTFSLVDANAAHLTESILADAEVQGAARSNHKTFLGGRLELLGDTKLYQTVEEQIRTQLRIALSIEKKELMPSRGPLPHVETLVSPTPDGAVSSDGTAPQNPVAVECAHNESRIVRIKIRLRHEHIVVIDEFDYDINTSGMAGCDPFSIASCLVADLKLPAELAPSIASSIVEQIYGVDVTGSLDAFTSNPAIHGAPTALALDSVREGSSADFAQVMLNN